MAGKNWLIRTKNRQILGPATKQKVIELLEKGSLSGEDEVTCGNGYWFWVRERDLIERYLYGDFPQSFNPISEAQDVLTASSTADGITASMTGSADVGTPSKEENSEPAGANLPEGGDLAYPDEDDLGYPDMGMATEPAPIATKPVITPSASKKESGPLPTANTQSKSSEPLEALAEGEDNTLYPCNQDLEYPELEGVAQEEVDPDSTAEIESVTLATARDEFEADSTDPNVHIPDLNEEFPEVEVNEFTEEEHEEEDLEEEVRPIKKRRKVLKKSEGNDRYLIYLGALLLIIIGVIIYYFKVIINKPIPYIGITSVHAQTISSLSKKKT